MCSELGAGPVEQRPIGGGDGELVEGVDGFCREREVIGVRGDDTSGPTGMYLMRRSNDETPADATTARTTRT